MAFDPKVYRNVKDGVGSPSDAAAANSTDENTLVSLSKGALYALQTGVPTVGGHTDDAAFTPGTGKVTIIGGLADETSPDTVDEGDGGAARMTLYRAFHVNLRDASGTAIAVGSGAVSAATLRVSIATDDAAISSLSVLDDWDESDRAKVNLIVGQAGIAAGAGAVGVTVPRVTLASDDPAVASLGTLDDAAGTVAAGTAGTKSLLTGGVFNTSAPAPSNGQQVALQLDANASLKSAPSASPSLGGIASIGRINSSAASTNATSLKASAGRVYAVQAYNSTSTVKYLKLYDKASSPTVGTDTPFKTLALPPVAAAAYDWPVGLYLGTGIAFALTGSVADSDTTALASGDVLALNIDYA